MSAFAHSPTLRVRDVTLAATDDLQTHREKLARIVLDEMYQFVGLLDTDGTTLEINRAALEGAGIQLEDIKGKPFWEARWWAVSKGTQDLQRDLVRRAREGEFVRCDVEIYGHAAGEETIVIDYSLVPVKDQNGTIVFLLPEGRNITEKKRIEAEIARKNEERQQLLDQIRRLDQVKSDFFANVSHELRTPLALILGPAESMLGTGDHLTERQRRDLAVIHRNATTLLKHVNDLLDIAKLDAGKQSVSYARVDVARDVRLVAAHFDALAPQRSIAYVVTSPDALEAEVDPEKLERIVQNLLANAFKFTPSGGRITCALEVVGDDRLRLSVQDTGPGVKPEMRTAIFERFRQAEGGTTRDFGGTGLGLAIAKDFVDLHGGTITVSDAPGGGALFQIELPRRAPAGSHVRSDETTRSRGQGAVVVDAVEELSPIEVQTPGNSGSPDRPLILVAEDHPDMRRFISEALGEEWRIVSAGDGAEALTRAIAETPDLVVTDLMMPKLGGDRLVAEMRSREPLAQVPVLVLSAKADEALRLKLLTESVQDYVVKPFSAHELRARVRNLLLMKRTRDALQQELAARREDLSRITQELEAAAIIQQGLMAVTIPQLPFAVVAGRNIPCSEIGGDFYSVTTIDEGVVVAIADVCGKGISAAIMASQLQGMIHEDLLSRVPLAEIARRANQFFCRRDLGSKYATLVMACLQPTGELEYLNCAHVPPLIATTGGRVVRLRESNVPVGLLPDVEFKTAGFHLSPTDRLILVTDGITEAQSPTGDFFGDERLEACAATPLDQMLASVHQFCAAQPLNDDCTVVELTYVGPTRTFQGVIG